MFIDSPNSKYNFHCPYNNTMFCIYSKGPASAHWHADFYEFCLFTYGLYIDVYNRNTYNCETGTLLLYRPGEGHELLVGENGGDHYTLIVHKKYFENYYQEQRQKFSHWPEILQFPQRFSKIVSGSQLTYLSHLASAISYNVSSERFSILKHFLDNLLFACMEEIPTGSAIGIDLYVNDILQRFDSYRNLDTDITELRSLYPVSQRTLTEHFKTLTNCSIVEYRNTKRMEYAAHLLEKENYQIAHIANMVGISSFSYFSKLFYEQYGMSPKQYQLLHRNKGTKKQNINTI